MAKLPSKERIEELDFEQDLEFSRHHLDTVMESHSEVFAAWGRAFADAIEAYEDAETELKLIRAETKNELELKRADLDTDIRQNPDKYDLDKVTDKSVESCIVRHEEYQELFKSNLQRLHEAEKEVVRTKHRKEVLAVAIESFRHRKSMIEGEMEGFVSQYWSRPSVSKETHDRAEEIREEERIHTTEEIGHRLTAKFRRNKTD